MTRSLFDLVSTTRVKIERRTYGSRSGMGSVDVRNVTSRTGLDAKFF